MSDKKQSKIYKKWWFWLLAVIIVIGLVCSFGKGSSKNDNSSSNKSEKATSGLTKSNYKKVQIGQSKDEVVKELGKPNTSSKTTTNGVESELLGWSKVSSAFNVGEITVTIDNGKVIGKGYTSPSLSKVKPLSKEKVDAFQPGASYKDVIDKLGQPTTEAYSSVMGQDSNLIQYVTSTKGDATSFMFMNDSLTSKTETHLN